MELVKLVSDIGGLVGPLGVIVSIVWAFSRMKSQSAEQLKEVTSFRTETKLGIEACERAVLKNQEHLKKLEQSTTENAKEIAVIKARLHAADVNGHH